MPNYYPGAQEYEAREVVLIHNITSPDADRMMQALEEEEGLRFPQAQGYLLDDATPLRTIILHPAGDTNLLTLRLYQQSIRIPRSIWETRGGQMQGLASY